MVDVYTLLDQNERPIAHGSREAVAAAAFLLLGHRKIRMHSIDSFVLSARSDIGPEDLRKDFTN